MDGPVTLMMQKTLLVRKDQAGYQERKKKRMLRVVRKSVLRRRRREGVVRGGLEGGFGVGGGRVVGLEGLEGGRRGRER